jgi:hypothetical protein
MAKLEKTNDKKTMRIVQKYFIPHPPPFGGGSSVQFDRFEKYS